MRLLVSLSLALSVFVAANGLQHTQKLPAVIGPHGPQTVTSVGSSAFNLQDHFNSMAKTSIGGDNFDKINASLAAVMSGRK